MSDEIQTSAELAEAAALPRMYVSRGDASGRQDVPLPEALAKRPVAQKSAAEWAYERLILYIKTFEETLDNSEEAAMGFAGSDGGVLRIEGIGYFDPDLVTFYGSDPSGAKTQLIQHVTQLNVMLRALPKRADGDDAPQRIGFRLARDLEQSDNI
jgi:hypothetical protein